MEKKETPNLSTKEFSLQAGVPVSTVTKMLREGKIAGTKQSGKWMIPADQVQLIGSVEFPHLPTLEKQKKKTVKSTPLPKMSRTDYSVEEFCQKTYLTEYGVLTWIKCGKLRGYQNKEGQWRIDAENFNLPTIKHLLRD